MRNRFNQFPAQFNDAHPTIPAGWQDTSWGNDVCPSYLTPNGLRVWVDHPDADKREFSEMPRYAVTRESEDGDVTELCTTDDWAQVLRVVREN